MVNWRKILGFKTVKLENEEENKLKNLGRIQKKRLSEEQRKLLSVKKLQTSLLNFKNGNRNEISEDLFKWFLESDQNLLRSQVSNTNQSFELNQNIFNNSKKSRELLMTIFQDLLGKKENILLELISAKKDFFKEGINQIREEISKIPKEKEKNEAKLNERMSLLENKITLYTEKCELLKRKYLAFGSSEIKLTNHELVMNGVESFLEKLEKTREEGIKMINNIKSITRGILKIEELKNKNKQELKTEILTAEEKLNILNSNLNSELKVFEIKLKRLSEDNFLGELDLSLIIDNDLILEAFSFLLKINQDLELSLLKNKELMSSLRIHLPETSSLLQEYNRIN